MRPEFRHGSSKPLGAAFSVDGTFRLWTRSGHRASLHRPPSQQAPAAPSGTRRALMLAEYFADFASGSPGANLGPIPRLLNLNPCNWSKPKTGDDDMSFQVIGFFAVALATVSCAEVAVAAPQALRGKSILINWSESRRERTESGEERSRNTPFKMTIYVSTQDRIFNRLSVGAGNSDQTAGSSDASRFASRSVVFSGSRVSVTNTFMGAAGARQISANFDANFTGCSANVAIGRSGTGQPVKQRLMGGGHVVLLSASVGSVNCSIIDGNALN